MEIIVGIWEVTLNDQTTTVNIMVYFSIFSDFPTSHLVQKVHCVLLKTETSINRTQITTRWYKCIFSCRLIQTLLSLRDWIKINPSVHIKITERLPLCTGVAHRCVFNSLISVLWGKVCRRWLFVKKKEESQGRVGGVHRPLATPHLSDLSAWRNRTWKCVILPLCLFLRVHEQERGCDARLHTRVVVVGGYKRVTLSSPEVWFGYVHIRLCMWSAIQISGLGTHLAVCVIFLLECQPVSVCWPLLRGSADAAPGPSGFYYKI